MRGAFVCRQSCLLFHLNVKTPVPDLTTLGIMLNPHFCTPVVFLQSKKALKMYAFLKEGGGIPHSLKYFSGKKKVSLRREIRMLNQSHCLKYDHLILVKADSRGGDTSISIQPRVLLEKKPFVLSWGCVLAAGGGQVVHRCFLFDPRG